MNAVLKPKLSTALTPEVLAEIDRIAYEVRVQHELRQDLCNEVPVRTRGRRVKKKPNIRLLLEFAERAAVENRGTK